MALGMGCGRFCTCLDYDKHWLSAEALCGSLAGEHSRVKEKMYACRSVGTACGVVAPSATVCILCTPSGNWGAPVWSWSVNRLDAAYRPRRRVVEA